jgi:uncharacterized protein (DUF2147 family)
MNKLIAAAALVTVAGAAFAEGATPAGLWKTIDDASGKERSLVRITDTGGVFAGTVEKGLDPARQHNVCDACTDERKGQPLVGMTIIRNVRKNERDEALWDGGDILDPDNGKVYKVRLRPVDGGSKLEVRGYIGAPLLGRTQTWIRVE